MIKEEKHTGFAIALAWPETLCKRAGAWYDFPLHYLKISKKGYYKVGHSAIVLVDVFTKKCFYFDFGRYHTPHGYGRVRSAETDHDLTIKTKALLSENNDMILNINEILKELYLNPSTHGNGKIYGAYSSINLKKAMDYIYKLQKKECIPYGPFTLKGTNCSRFVNNVIRKGCTSYIQKLMLQYPLTLTPTPMWNLKALSTEIYCYEENSIDKNKTFVPQKNIAV